MTSVGKILLYIHFDASMIETTLESKFDFSDRLEVGQFCLLVELNLELYNVSLQTNTAITCTFTFLLKDFVSGSMYAEWKGK